MKKVPWLTAAQLVEQTPDLKWLIKNWFPLGVMSVFSGPGKLAGKSTLVRAMIRSVLSGEPFLGEAQEVVGDVLYLSEETPMAMKQSLFRADLQYSEGLHILPWLNVPDGMGWKSLLKEVEKKANETKAVWCIIDTLGHFTLGGDKDENSSSDAIEIMRPITRLAHNTGMGVLIIKHTRKAGGGLGDSDRGTGAYGGAADAIWTMRPRGKSTQRILESAGRIEGVPTKVTLDWDGGRNYVIVDCDWGALAKRVEEDGLMRALPGTRDEICMRLSHLSVSTISRKLNEALKAGRIVVEGTGVKGDPKIFRKV